MANDPDVSMLLGSWDWVIMSATIIASAAIGVYYRFSGGRQKTNEEFIMADKNMPVFTVAVSLMNSFMSAITLLGVSSENYGYGAIFTIINFAYGISTPIACYLYLPVFFNLQNISTYEYLELRFGPKIRLIASLTYALQMVMYNGIVLYAPAIVLEQVTGLNRVVSILVIGLICTFYATIGGMKAVMVTDLIQCFLMYAAVISVVVFGSLQVGGLDVVFKAAQEGGRLQFDNFSFDPTERHTIWSLLFGGMIIYLTLNAVNHTQIHRLLTVSTLKKSQLCLWLAWPIVSALSLVTSLAGIVIYAVYKNCDPYTAGYINSIDQVMPHYVIESMRHIPGLAGLFIAGIFSASLSTLSSACHSLSAVTLQDYIGKLTTIKPTLQSPVTKVIACCYGIVFLALAFLAEHLGGLLQASLTIFAIVGGPLLGLFTLGMFTTFANEKGAITSLISGMALTFWMSFGTPRPPAQYLSFDVSECPGNVTIPESVPYDPSNYFYLYRLSYAWTSPIGFVWVVVVGSLVSLLWRMRQPWQRPNGSGEPDPALFTPPLANRLRKRQTMKTPL